jgi:RNA polymerase sigma factor for flagellar operon FliA
VATRYDDLTEAELWSRYKQDREPEIRSELILRYYPLARRVAASVWKTTPSQVDLEDLVSYAVSGLIRAIDHFNPDKGVNFTTYAPVTIRGGIIDEIRSLDWVPRSLRRKQRDIARARAELEAQGLDASTAAVADRLGITTDDVVSVERATDAAHIRSLDETHSSPEGRSREDAGSRYDLVEDKTAPDPVATSQARSVTLVVQDAIRQLPMQEQLVVVLYYFEDLTLADVGRIVGIPESRASQIHSKVVMEVREAMLEVLT